METKPRKKLEKITFDQLTVQQQEIYITQAEYLKTKGYLSGNITDIATDIYNKRRK